MTTAETPKASIRAENLQLNDFDLDPEINSRKRYG
jgi:hypothetical protein